MKNKMKSPLEYKKNTLHFDGQSLGLIAKKWQTPFYLYSKKTIEFYYNDFTLKAQEQGLDDILICYAIKANNNKDVLKLLKKLGSGADVVSGGELKLALKAGIHPSKIVFSGVGKTDEEIEMALKCHKNGIYSFNVESLEELADINRIAKKLNKVARVAFRLNPQVHAKTHRYIATGNKTHKFGILAEDILVGLKSKKYWSHSKLVGLSIHIGSQLTEMKATKEAIKELSDLALKINRPLEFLDLGGGLGIDYTEEERKELTSTAEYMKAIHEALDAFYYKKTEERPKIVFEPGRILVGKMGILLSKVIRTKVSGGNHFTIIDAGMNDLIRPALYEAHHDIYPVMRKTKEISTDIVGPICESADCFGSAMKLPPMKNGDFVVIDNAGAYGHTMSSTYNERQRVKEVLL